MRRHVRYGAILDPRQKGVETITIIRRVAAEDGVELAVHEQGGEGGRPVVLLHGLMSSADVNWIKYGTAQRLADAGFRCIMPDLRGHGESDAPHEASAYPKDVLVRDMAGIIAAYGLTDYDLCGFSLGARTAIKFVIDGGRPRHLVAGGMGYEGLTGWSARRDHFIDLIDNGDRLKRGDKGWLAVQFMKTTGIDRQAARHVVESFGDLDPAGLADIPMPTLVLNGEEDRDNGSPAALADALPRGRLAEIPGNHMSCVTRPAFGAAIVNFLTA